MRRKLKEVILKNKDIRPCSRCDYKFPKDKTKCPSCGFWNVLSKIGDADDQTILLSDVLAREYKRYQTGPWDICFGQNAEDRQIGIVTTGVTIIGGSPGAGKSTLSAQICDAIASHTQREVLYICTEEATPEIKARIERIRIKNVKLIRVSPMGATHDIGQVIQRRRPRGIIIDSLAGMTSDIEEQVAICKSLKDYSVELESPSIIIDHINKKGELAGLMTLQHAVDTTMTLFPISERIEDERREMVVVKNRFGKANFSKGFLMTERDGLIAHALPEEEEDEEDDDD